MSLNVCCFTGHRPGKLGFGENSIECRALKAKTEELIIRLIEEKGINYFISGMALGVDMYAAEIVIKLKERYPQIKLECALPCANQTAKWNDSDKEAYRKIIDACDKAVLLQEEYTNDCMQRRNRYMVDNSGVVLAVWNGKPSGTGSTVRYARSKGVAVLLLDPVSLIDKYI